MHCGAARIFLTTPQAEHVPVTPVRLSIATCKLDYARKCF